MNAQWNPVRVTMLVSVGLLLASGAAAAQPAGPAVEEREARLDAARERLEQAAREIAELSRDALGRSGILRFQTRGDARAALGISIAGEEGRRDEGNRRDGVPVMDVSPGGPAADAGLRAGDVLVSIDGKPLKWEGDRSPQAALLAFMEVVEPGATVNVEYRRDGKLSKADIVAEPMNRGFAAGSRGLPMLDGPLGPRAALFRGPGVFGGVELVPLTPKLGQYFGTDKGLLVVRAPADSRLGLEEGDVIVDIAGRVPAGPGHALRILDSYQAGEKLTLNVMRLKKKQTLTIEIPADSRRGRAIPEGPGRPRTPGPAGGSRQFNVPVPPPGPRDRA